MSTVEDPIYAIARKRKRDWQVIAQQVSKTKPRGPATPVAKPYNLRGGGLPAPGGFPPAQLAAAQEPLGLWGAGLQAL